MTFPCNDFLKKRLKMETGNCTFYDGEDETVEHSFLFFYCSYIRTFWDSFQTWIVDFVVNSSNLMFHDIKHGVILHDNKKELF